MSDNEDNANASDNNTGSDNESNDEVSLSLDEKRQLAKQHLREKHFQDACDLFDDILACLVEEHGDSAVECVEGFIDVGEAYLKFGAYKNEQMVLGTLAGVKPDDEKNAEPSAPKKSSKVASFDDDDDDDDDDNDDDNNKNDQQKTAPNSGENAGEEDPLEVAWNMLESACVILRKHGAKEPQETSTTTVSEEHTLQLADVLMLLADVSLEQGNIPTAVEDYTRALAIRKALLPPHHRDIVATLTMIAQAHQLDNKETESLEFYKQAEDLCKQCIQMLRQQQTQNENTNKELTELEACLEDYKDKIEELTQQPAQTPQASAPTTSSKFDAPSANAKPAKNLGVVGGKVKRITLKAENGNAGKRDAPEPAENGDNEEKRKRRRIGDD